VANGTAFSGIFEKEDNLVKYTQIFENLLPRISVPLYFPSRISGIFDWMVRISKMNELPVIGYPYYAQRTLGSPGGKHCKSLEGNVWRKVVSTSKKRILERNQHFFAIVLSQMDLCNVDMRKM